MSVPTSPNRLAERASDARGHSSIKPSEPASSPAHSRLHGLDVMRGLAVLMVVASHFLPHHIPNETLAIIVRSFGLGGVVMFFNLSGFLVYKSINEVSLVSFILRRVSKIFPAYWAAIALYYFFAATGQVQNFPPEVYITNLLLIQEASGGALLLGHFWTLAVEIKFYALVAVLDPILKRSFPLIILIFMVGANVIFYIKTGRGSTLLTNIPIFFAGVLVYSAKKKGWSAADKIKVAAFTIALSAIMVVFQEYNRFEYAVFVLLSVPALCFALEYTVRNSFLPYFGRISYSLYLLHPLIGMNAETVLIARGFPGFLATIIAVLLSVAFADLSYRLIEVPGSQLGKRLGEFRLKARPA